MIVQSRLPHLPSCGPIEALYNLPNAGEYRAAFCICQVAAPLKLLERDVPVARVHPFRSCQVAAPLKRGRRREPHGNHGRLPQLSSCGPIEATACRRAITCPMGLPQLSSCGPIEAWRARQAALAARAFRNCQVAAPLKHTPCGASGHEPAFRNCQAAAPLKPGRSELQNVIAGPSATAKLRPH